MKDKINAYHKISLTIESSRNELHLKTCSLMISVFSVRFKDPSIEELLKECVRNKKKQIIEKRFARTRSLC